MTECRFLHTAMPDPQYGAVAPAPTVVHSRCETHNFGMSLMRMTTSNLCPIGQIEEATEVALAKIKEASSNAD